MNLYRVTLSDITWAYDDGVQLPTESSGEIQARNPESAISLYSEQVSFVYENEPDYMTANVQLIKTIQEETMRRESMNTWKEIEKYKQDIVNGDAIVDLWTIQDVMDVDETVTPEEARIVLALLEEHYDANYGIDYELIESEIRNYRRNYERAE